MKLSLLQKALEASREGRAAALATNLKNGRQSLIEGTDFVGDLPVDAEILAGVKRALTRDASDSVMTDEGKVFIEVFNPRLRLIIVGAVHIAQPLARIASIAGYLVTVIDPRTAFASDERFPDVVMVTDWPDEAMAKLKPNRRTAVVTLTHDPKLDDPALQVALKSDAFYIGALGSRKTHAKRLDRLAQAGFTPEETARIHGPVGLDIDAVSPAEIAVSIVAEITEILRAQPVEEQEVAA